MATGDKPTSAYGIVAPDDVENHYDGSDVPGDFPSLTDPLGCDQLAVTLIRVRAHADFEQGTGHFHEEIEELYLVTRGTLTMRFGDEIERVSAPAAVRGAPHPPRSPPPAGGAPRARPPARTRQRGRRAGRDVGDLAQERSRRRDEARRLLGRLA